MVSIYRKCIILTITLISIGYFTYQILFQENSKYAIESKLSQENLNLSLFPKDHLDGVRLEVDGDINMDYLREILFGIDHHLISSNNKNVAIKTIKKLFYLNDQNHDKYLDQDEVYQLISNNIKSHFDKAMKANREAVNQLKDPETNSISWKSYVTKYLQLNNKNKAFIETYLKNSEYFLLPGKDRDFLNNAYRHWINADLNGDKSLNETEYLGFLHPELNLVSLDRMCDKIMTNLDLDMNGKLTENEFIDKTRRAQIAFITPYPGFVNSEEDKEINSDSVETRLKQFQEIIDINHDGFADRAELREYINPKNNANVYKDAKDIIDTIDENSDKKLTLFEMIKNYQKVINSKLVNIAAVFHNDL